jgi:hypothetical protein
VITRTIRCDGKDCEAFQTGTATDTQLKYLAIHDGWILVSWHLEAADRLLCFCPSCGVAVKKTLLP